MAEVPQGMIRVVSAEIQREGRYLIAQRYPTAVLPLLWEFPGGRVREGQTDEERLLEALTQRVGVKASVGEKLMEVVHDYGTYQVTLAVYRCSTDGDPWPRHVNAIAWVLPEDFADYPFPGADQQTVELLLAEE